MSAYTDKELLAVGIRRLGLTFDGQPKWGVKSDGLGYKTAYGEPGTWWGDRHLHGHDAQVRLALEHPERADEALGPGWSIDGSHFNWRSDTTPGLFLRVAEGVVQLSAWCAVIPPEFDAALQRARLIAAAWQRIEATR